MIPINRALELYNALLKFPRVNLGIFPTPIHKLNNLEKRISHDSLWIKRDDLTGLAFGGNNSNLVSFRNAIHKKCDTMVYSQFNQTCCMTAAANKLRLLHTSLCDDSPRNNKETLCNQLLVILIISGKKIYLLKRSIWKTWQKALRLPAASHI